MIVVRALLSGCEKKLKNYPFSTGMLGLLF
jgi:hypothetical protein